MRGDPVNGPATARPVLRVEALSKRFGGTQAVDDVSLDLHAGEILALLGENGAGVQLERHIVDGLGAAEALAERFDAQHGRSGGRAGHRITAHDTSGSRCVAMKRSKARVSMLK